MHNRKAILISIKPKYVAKILNGEKTIEVRKSKPKCNLPIDVYIYCTKQNAKYYIENKIYNSMINGKVVAKFTLNKVEEIKLPYTKFGSSEWVGCEEERTLQTQTMNEETLLEKCCLEEDEIYGYLNFKKSPNNVGYAWHISNLIIFDKPRELSEFKIPCDFKCPKLGCCYCHKNTRLTKSPQSWQFIEVVRR